jgi:hypothetical protein
MTWQEFHKALLKLRKEAQRAGSQYELELLDLLAFLGDELLRVKLRRWKY